MFIKIKIMVLCILAVRTCRYIVLVIKSKQAIIVLWVMVIEWQQVSKWIYYYHVNVTRLQNDNYFTLDSRLMCAFASTITEAAGHFKRSPLQQSCINPPPPPTTHHHPANHCITRIITCIGVHVAHFSHHKYCSYNWVFMWLNTIYKISYV